jgi:hypothetical protein
MNLHVTRRLAAVNNLVVDVSEATRPIMLTRNLLPDRGLAYYSLPRLVKFARAKSLPISQIANAIIDACRVTCQRDAVNGRESLIAG